MTKTKPRAGAKTAEKNNTVSQFLPEYFEAETLFMCVEKTGVGLGEAVYVICLYLPPTSGASFLSSAVMFSKVFCMPQR